MPLTLFAIKQLQLGSPPSAIEHAPPGGRENRDAHLKGGGLARQEDQEIRQKQPPNGDAAGHRAEHNGNAPSIRSLLIRQGRFVPAVSIVVCVPPKPLPRPAGAIPLQYAVRISVPFPEVAQAMASISSTERFACSLSRLASTQPAVPPPTLTMSKLMLPIMV
jgi:hypothetical protein